MPNPPLAGPASQPVHDVTIQRYRIPMRDGVRLFATAWQPAGEGRFPVILSYDPYRSSDNRMVGRANIFHFMARHGYVVMHLNVRGTDGSEGTVSDEYVPQEQEDGFDAVEWAAAQPWCNGSVGMFGTSYSAFTCLQVAMHQPPHLKAIVPVYGTDDRYTDDVHYVGGALYATCDITDYGTVMVGRNALPPHASLGPELASIWQAHLEGDEPYQFQWLAHQTDGPYWRHASVRPGYDRIQCPVFVIGGWMDGYKNPTVRLFQHLSAPCKALMGPWGHVFPQAGLPGPAIDFVGQTLPWYDHWLKGLDTGMLDEPRLTVYMQEYDPPRRDRVFTTGYWRAEPSWPVPGAAEQQLYLAAGGELAPQAGVPGEDRLTYRATVGATNRSWPGEPWLGCPEDQRPDEVHSLVYTSAPLEQPLEILGWPTARLAFASTAPVVNIVCKLCDVAPDGASALITWGILNATHRNSHTDPEPLVPGERYTIDVPLDVTGWVFAPGHRIRLDISGSDWPNVWPSPYPAENTVWWGGEDGSSLTLPVVPAGQREAAPVFDQKVIPYAGVMAEGLPTEISVTRYPYHERSVFELREGNRGHLVNEDTRIAYDCRAKFTVSDRDPANATYAVEQTNLITRRGTPINSTVHALLESTLDTFHLSFEVRVTVGEVERFTRSWQRSFPRYLV